MITNTGDPPSTVRGGFDGNAYEVVHEALSQSVMPENVQGRSSKKPFLQSLQNLIRLQEDASSWSCPPILIDVTESWSSDRIIQIDIAETLLGDKGRNVPSSEKRIDDNCFWFAKLFNTNVEDFREKEIVPELLFSIVIGRTIIFRLLIFLASFFLTF